MAEEERRFEVTVKLRCFGNEESPGKLVRRVSRELSTKFGDIAEVWYNGTRVEPEDQH